MASSTNTLPLSWRLSVAVPAGESSVPTEAVTHQQHFLCSSDPALIQLDALHQAMASDVLWWATPLEPSLLAAMVNNSICLGVYRLAAGDDEEAREMVGFARLITDRVTFAYMTDVYVLPPYQKRGLGTWLMRCLREMLVGTPGDPSNPGWPALRSLWLVASTPAAARIYMTTLGAEEAARYRPRAGVPDSGMILLEMPGPTNSIKEHEKKNLGL